MNQGKQAGSSGWEAGGFNRMAPRGLSGRGSGVLKEAREETARAAGAASAEALGQERHGAFVEQVTGNGASERETSRGSCPGHGEGSGASKPKGTT